MMPTPPKEAQFKPGESGNPKGRPKGTSIQAIIRRIVSENEGEIAEALVKSAIKNALKGDYRFWKEILDRVDGKVPEALEHTGADGQPLTVVINRPGGKGDD